MPASSLEMAEKRFQVARSSHLTAVVARDRLKQERQHRVKSWEKSVRDLMAEKAKYEELLESQNGSAEQDGDQLQEKVQQVRSLWAAVEKVLSSLREKQRIMDRVLQGDVDQYVLDGADMKLRVPTVLQERMEKMTEQTSRGSQWDSTQPSLLHLLELLKEALAILNEERLRALVPTAELHTEAHSKGPTVELDGEALCQLMTQIAQAQEDLRKLRTRMSKEDIPQTRSAVRKAEANWDRKWAELLKNSVLSSVMSADPGVDVLPAMAALSFEPAPEDRLRSNALFCPPPAVTEPEQETPQRCQTAVEEMVARSFEETDRFHHIPTSAEQSSDELECVPEETPMLPCVVASPRPVTPLQPTPEHPPLKSPSVALLKDKKTRPPNTQTKKSAVKKKADILDLEFENLAEQFAQAVTTTPEGDKGGIGLEHLLSSMIEPLSARRQIPRTPESLIADVRTSWRKAVEDGVTQKVRPSGKFPDSFTGLFTPYSDTSRGNVNQDASSMNTTDIPISTTIPLGTPAGSFTQPNRSASVLCSPTHNQQEAAVPFLMSLDSSHVESLTSPSASKRFEFSIANETIPELSSGDSLLSNDSFLSNCSRDLLQEEVKVEDREEEEEEEELVLPQVTSLLEGDKMSALLLARQRLQTILEESSYAKPNGQDLLSFSPAPAPAPALGTPQQGSRGRGAGDSEAPQRVFSLDLDQFESPSPPHQGDMHLSNLLTFSPGDQL